MAIIKKGLLSGEELVRHYSSANKKKIYFHSGMDRYGIWKCLGFGPRDPYLRTNIISNLHHWYKISPQGKGQIG